MIVEVTGLVCRTGKKKERKRVKGQNVGGGAREGPLQRVARNVAEPSYYIH